MREERATNCCEPEVLFDLAEGSLDHERRLTVKAHIEACPRCEARYEREVALSAGFCSGDVASKSFSPEPRRDRESVSREVAMCIPNRSGFARLAWGILALGMLAVTIFAFGADGPVFAATSGAESFFGYVAATSDLFTMIVIFIAPVLFALFAVGLVIDVVLAAVLFFVARQGVSGRRIPPAGHTRGA